MIDPSLVELLNIKGSPSKPSLTTVHSVDAEEVGMKVDFKIGSVDSQNENVIDVKSAWVVKDLTIPLKHTRVIRSVAQYHLRFEEANVMSQLLLSRVLDGAFLVGR